MDSVLNKRNKWLYLMWACALISCVMTLIPLRNTLFSCDDSISNFVYGRLTDSSFSFNSAFKFSLMRGKLGFIFPFLITIRDYLYRHGNYVLFWLMQYVPVYVNVFLSAYFVSRKLSKELAPVFVTLFSGLLQVNGWHSLITCYPIEFMYGLTMALLGVILFDRYITAEKPKAVLMVLSVICYYESMQTYEAFLLFAVFYAFLALYEKDSWKLRFKSLIPHIITGVIYVGIFIYLNIHPVVESNGYNVTTPGTLKGLVITDVIFSMGMFPMADILFPSVRHGINLSSVTLTTVIGAISATAGIIIFLLKSSFEAVNRKKYIHAGIVGTTMALIFPLMHSMTSKYQEWAVVEHQFGYVPTTISYFGWVLAVISFAVVLFDIASKKKPELRKALVSVVAVIVFIATLLTGVINTVIRVKGIGPTSPKLSYKAQSVYALATSDEFSRLNCDLLYVPDFSGVHELFLEHEFLIQHETKNDVIIDVINDLETFEENFDSSDNPMIYRYFYDQDVGVLITPESTDTGTSVYVISSHGFNGTISFTTESGTVSYDVNLNRNETFFIENSDSFNIDTLKVTTS